MLVLAIGSFSMPVRAQDAQWPVSSEDDLRKAITGATITGEVKAQPPFNFTEFLGPDGKSRGKLIECCNPDKVLTNGTSYAGEWTLEKDNLCLLYEGEEQKVCWRLQVKGDQFRMTDDKSGYSGEGKIRSGNPDNL
ncbi:hypothetical protein HB779_18160 [Phyllobacterium sp. 628]|uniref:hypothetical protein n=1 Tax=Phyllobacterium sp. 628 TaxID=2718938 RepID=UPI0016627E2C|nr:hypothetical protein [Phyllobacterium sp. 628]QND53598.1 hypothetical protein HB779_18160 [Phyllobacterium sp. 628]